MPKLPRLPAAQVKANLAARVARQDRGPFQELLAETLHYKPKPKALRELAKDPEKHARTVKTYAQLAGYIERKESLNVSMTAKELADTLVARYGAEKARKMLELHNLPQSLIPDSKTETIDASPITTPETAPDSPESANLAT